MSFIIGHASIFFALFVGNAAYLLPRFYVN
jgi:hypothetical protein